MVKGSSIPARKRDEHLRPEEDQNILAETLARFSARFLAGIEEPFTIHATAN